MPTNTDRIEKQIHLRAPVARVWRAIADAEEFGRWFGLRLQGGFTAGKTVRGQIVIPPGFEHLAFEMAIERVEPERRFAFRWHPYAIDPKIDYSGEPTTLVELQLEARDGGTMLTLTESGFDALPPERRKDAFRMNGEGWAVQLQNVAKHVGSAG
jgi:uncharacterized protein YndB with AHSA1/START domain